MNYDTCTKKKRNVTCNKTIKYFMKMWKCNLMVWKCVCFYLNVNLKSNGSIVKIIIETIQVIGWKFDGNGSWVFFNDELHFDLHTIHHEKW